MFALSDGELLAGRAAVLLPAAAAFMLIVVYWLRSDPRGADCPAQPTEALKADA